MIYGHEPAQTKPHSAHISASIHTMRATSVWPYTAEIILKQLT